MRPRFLAATLVVGLSAGQTGTSHAVQLSARPLTADQITAVIGSDADARAVMSMFLKESFPSGEGPRTEYVLRSQVRDEWLPKVTGVKIVHLSDADATARVASCGTYFVLAAQRQSSGAVRVTRQPKCIASVHGTDFALRDGQWPVSSGIGSGWVGTPPAECTRCIKR